MRGEALRNWVSKCSSPCRKLDAFQFFSRENELLCTSSCSSQVISSVLQRMRATSTSQSSVPSWDFFFKEIFQILLSLGHLWGGNDHLCLSWWGGKLELQFGVWTTIALDELTFVWRHIVNLEWRKKKKCNYFCNSHFPLNNLLCYALCDSTPACLCRFLPLLKPHTVPVKVWRSTRQMCLCMKR